ncbi:hypothetical protein EK21DRAFT_118202 [Setomelanomma holmii]|uniref:Uncharacterized protein n=1 Tax=Setomelanomma holmii TaxID=210430 RepID=A0A9P4GYT2_9PLEO|nr:hypothetical protein EK21DRAFT_118202 [Setomelanomma holmii]
MPFRFSKSSTSSSPKGNTIKKSEIVDGRRTRKDTRSDRDHKEGIVDPVTVDEWLKDEANADDEKPLGVLRNANFSNGAIMADGEHACTKSLEAKIEDTSKESVESSVDVTLPSATSETQSPSAPPTLNILVGTHNPSSRYFTRQYLRVHTRPNIIVNGSSAASSESTHNALISLPNFDPLALDLFQTWFNTGVIPWRSSETCRSSQRPDE